MAIWAYAVVSAASCCVSWAFTRLRVSAACAPATSRVTDADTWSASRLNPLNSVQLRAKRSDQDRKSTRLNSSHSQISYAVFCLKKKKQNPRHAPRLQSPPAMHQRAFVECCV